MFHELSNNNTALTKLHTENYFTLIFTISKHVLEFLFLWKEFRLKKLKKYANKFYFSKYENRQTCGIGGTMGSKLFWSRTLIFYAFWNLQNISLYFLISVYKKLQVTCRDKSKNLLKLSCMYVRPKKKRWPHLLREETKYELKLVFV